jgi:hypothetical protein
MKSKEWTEQKTSVKAGDKMSLLAYLPTAFTLVYSSAYFLP